MQRADIILGEEYGLRENRQLGAPLQRVRIVQHVRGHKWRAEWVEPNPGLLDYVDGRTLLVRWRDSDAFLTDERAELRLREDNVANAYDEESPVAGALYAVFEATGDRACFYRGDLHGPPDAFERVRARAGVDPLGRTSLEYVDRHGSVHLPFADALALAKSFCEAEAQTVIAYVELSRTPTKFADLLAKFRAQDALVLQWCGSSPSSLQHRENQRLLQLVRDAADALSAAGRLDVARTLRQEIGDPSDDAATKAPASSGTTSSAATQSPTWTWRGRVRHE